MKKRDIIEGTVKRIDFPNVGIVETAEGEVRVKNTLPHQKVRARISKVRKGKYEGTLLDIIEPAAIELTDVCPHFGKCGGCLYASIPYDEEIKIKEQQIRRLIEPVIGSEKYDEIYNGIVKSPNECGYRNKMEFSFGDEYKDGPMALGMHKRGAFYDIVTVSDCRIVDEDYRKILKATLDFFVAKNIPFFNKNTHEGFLRHLLLRKAHFTGEILVDLVTASGMDEDVLSEYAKCICDIELRGSLVGILHTKNDRISDVVEDQGTRVLYGKEYFTEKLLGLNFKITPFSFFQTNSAGAERLYDIVRSLMPKSGTVFDLYCGTGTIAQIISPAAQNVVGVEIVKEAVVAAEENAIQNGIKNVRFIADDVFKALDNIPEKPDMIILDPPREGVNPKALKKIIAYGVEKIIYVSCKPTSLARDLAIFEEEGYVPEYLSLVDMFPRTGNCETITLISKSRHSLL